VQGVGGKTYVWTRVKTFGRIFQNSADSGLPEFKFCQILEFKFKIFEKNQQNM
jgi:hypothetical protein